MNRFKNILYVAEIGRGEKTFQHAVDIAERNDARLTVILPVKRIPAYLAQVTPHSLPEIRIKELRASLDSHRDLVAGRVNIETKLVEGIPFLEVIRDVLRNGRDLVIKSASGTGGVNGWLFATTDMHLLRKCPCPVWLFKSTDRDPIRRILAAVDVNDFDPPNQDSAEPVNRMILELAGSLAFLEGAELNIVHVWSAPAEGVLGSGRTGLPAEEVDAYVEEIRQHHEGWLKQLMDKAENWIGQEIFNSITVQLHTPKGSARSVIPSLAQDLNIDLLVMGTVGRIGIPGLFIGNTAESVFRQIDCSVLAVKPPGFVTPVTLEP